MIISDALRYEIADELLRRVRCEDRYDAELEAMLAMLPSYTQLGMAALLPNAQIALAEDQSGYVLMDGISSAGTAARDKILKQAVPRSLAIRSEEFLTQNHDANRDTLRDHDIIYLYQNQIDDAGDKRESEERIFEAVENALDESIVLIKKLTAANATKIIVTADHSFI
ncbi:MAG: PglZ domain-containing protein [Chloroflexota bacterium]